MSDKLNQIIIDVLNISDDIENITSDHENWDSFAHLNLILAMDEEFDIEIPVKDFPKLYADYDTLLNYVESKIKKN